jgi:hypothetical protein
MGNLVWYILLALLILCVANFGWIGVQGQTSSKDIADFGPVCIAGVIIVVMLRR